MPILLFFLIVTCVYGHPADNLFDKLDEYLTRTAELGFSGAVLVEKDGDVVLHKGYGLAERSKQIAVTTETIFTTGSITKQFTAAAILKLEMQGKVATTDLLSKYFDDVPHDKSGITLHHLLTHSAGFAPALGDDFEVIDRQTYLSKAIQSELLFEPGQHYQYSNVGYSLLAVIVETVSGQSYQDFLKKQFLIPAGMRSTGYTCEDWQPDQLAHGYRLDEDWGTPLDHTWTKDGPYWHLRGNGGILTTTGDMYRWHIALQDDSILSAQAKLKMFKPYIREGEDDTFYGYGWVISETDRKTRVIQHNGGNGYFSADFKRFVDDDVMLYITSNVAEHKAFHISRILTDIIYGRPYQLPIPKVEMTWQAARQTRAGPHVLAYLNAMANPDDTLLSQFIESHLSKKITANQDRNTLMRELRLDQEELGQSSLPDRVLYGETSMEFTIKTERGNWLCIRMAFDSEPPFGITGWGFEDTIPPGD